MLQLPQSVHYSNQANRRYDGELYATLSKLHFSIASRDPNGVALGRETFNVPVYPCPDIAFMMGPAQASAWFLEGAVVPFPQAPAHLRNLLRQLSDRICSMCFQTHFSLLHCLVQLFYFLSWLQCAPPYAAQLKSPGHGLG